MTDGKARRKAGPVDASSERVVAIERLTFGGEGVARVDGKVVFVPDSLPGERLRARYVERRRRWDRAELIDVLRPSPHRIPSGCLHEERAGCGGCGLRHVRGSIGFRLKAESALAEMRKLAPEVTWPALTYRDVGVRDGARWRVRFHVADGRLGLFRRGSHELVPIPECRAAHPDVLAGAAALEPVLANLKRARTPGTLVVERAESGLYAHWPRRVDDPQARAALRALVDHGPFAGLRIGTARDTTDLGAPYITEVTRLGPHTITYQRRVGAFSQANPAVNTVLRCRVRDWLAGIGGGGRILDLYAGSGNLSLVAALSADHVTAVELDRDALDGLSASLEVNQLAPIVVRRRDLARGLGDLTRPDQWDAVVLDPPRSGARAVMPQLAKMQPRHILYVSCSPPHLARDLRAIGTAYEVVRLDALDMFPRTPHVELIAQLIAR